MDQQDLFPGYKQPKKKKSWVVREVAPRYWSDMEILTLIVGANVAEEILSAVNNNLFFLHDYEVEQLAQFDGIGSKKAWQIKAMLELGRRIADSKMSVNTSFSCPHEVYNFLREEMRYYRKEFFKAILLNVKNCVISTEDIAVGSLNSTIVHPRELFNPAVKKSAASIILAHNHPSGDPSPSKEDLIVTKRLVEGGELLGIKVLDHIVIGSERYFSFKEQGIMPEIA